MSIFRSVWINLFSAIGVMIIFSFPISELFGTFIVALAGEARVAQDPWVGVVGRAFGVSILVLLGIGSVLVPLELLNYGRFYEKHRDDTQYWRGVVRQFLLISMSIFSLLSIVLFFVIFAALT